VDLQVEQWPIERVLPYDKNPRLNDAAVDRVAESLANFGWRQPLVVDKDGVLIVGHTRLLAAKKRGELTVPVHVARDLPPEKAKAYRLADNRTSEYSEWDFGLVAAELLELKTYGDDMLKASAFSPEDLQNLLGANWTPPQRENLPSRDHHHTVHFTEEQWKTVNEAVSRASTMNVALTTSAAALEEIARAYLARSPS
jgi:hypothetical protein